MFKKIKKARSLMDEPDYAQDEFNWVQLFLLSIFIIIITLITYSNIKVNKEVKNNIQTNNPVVESFQDNIKLESAIYKYGDVNKEYEPLENN